MRILFMLHRKTAKRNILLLGASGFLGKNLKEHLLIERKDLIIDSPSSSELNLLDEESVSKFLNSKKYDVIINAAVFNSKRINSKLLSMSELEADLRMFLNLHKNKDKFGKMFYFGSGAEFDKTKPICNVQEMSFLNGLPKNQYGIAKYTIGKLIEASDNIYNLRVFGLFGKYENWKTTFISGACCKAIKGLPITIRQNVFFDYIYIDDFCNIIDWFIDHTPKYHTYNVTSGKSIDLVTLANIVIDISGKKLPLIICQNGLGNEYTSSNARLLDEMGSSFKLTDYKLAIRELYEFYSSIEDQIDLESLLYQN